MACLEVPKVPVLQLPSPLTLPIFAPDLSIATGLNLCCNVHYASPTLLEVYGALGGPPLPPGPTINLAVINTVLGYVDLLNQEIDKFPKLTCPLDS